MSTLPKTFFTAEQYLEIDRAAEFKSEYFDGEIFAMSGASTPHNIIVWNLILSLGKQLEGRPCQGFPSDARVCIDRKSRYAYPDVSVVCGKAEFLDGRLDVLLNPTLVVEVLSRSTESHDRNFKFEAYWAIPSLQQYVLVSSLHQSIEVYSRQPQGRPVIDKAFRDEDSAALDSIGCRLTVADVYRNVDFSRAESA
jgi:Uma2 family endonuclease